MARRTITAPITGPASNRTMSIPGLVDEMNLAVAQAYTDFTAADAALDQRLDALEAGGSGGGGLTSVAHDNSLTGAGTTGSPLGVARPVPSGAEGQVVGYGPNGVLAPVTLSGGGTLPANVPTVTGFPPDTLTTPFVPPAQMTVAGRTWDLAIGAQISVNIQRFGVVVSGHTEAEPSQAVMEANLAGFQDAINKASELGFCIRLPAGRIYIYGTLMLLIGVSIRGESKFSSQVHQRMLPTSLSQSWVKTFAAPPVTGARQGGNGRNFMSDFTIDGGWNKLDFIGATGGNFNVDMSRMVGHAVEIVTSSSGPMWSAVRQENAASDAHARFVNMNIVNVPGVGLSWEGRGENFAIGCEFSSCAVNAIKDAAADCWILDCTGAVIGDCGVEVTGAGGNLRIGNTKMWYCGMARRGEVVGAGYFLSASGLKNMCFVGATTQDTWGPGFVLRGEGAIYISGQVDEPGGGRVTQGGLGYAGTRTYPRSAIRLENVQNAHLDITVSGGNLNGAANRPGFVHISHTDANNNYINIIPHLLSTFDMAAGSDPLLKHDGVSCTQAHYDAAKYNEVWINKRRLIWGRMTLAMLNNASHAVNDPLQGPSQVLMDTGMPAYPRNYGGWYVPTVLRPLTQAQYNALPAAEQNDPVYIFQIVEAA